MGGMTLAASLLLCVVSGDGDSESMHFLKDFETLAGHKSVEVLVMVAENRFGIREKTLKPFVERTLADAGVHLRTPEDPGVGDLRVVISISEAVLVTSFTVQVEFSQPVMPLFQDGGKGVLIGTTWERGTFGVFPGDDASIIRDGVKSSLSAFVDDWKRAHRPAVDPFK